MPQPATRLAGFSESVIRGMTRLANRHGAINLAQGFPDFEPPEELLAALERATRGPFHQYAVTWGAPRFREALARKITRWSGLAVEPDQHLVVAAAEWFVREVGVVPVPGSSFFREPEHRFIRFHFAKKEETLRAAGERLATLDKHFPVGATR